MVEFSVFRFQNHYVKPDVLRKEKQKLLTQLEA